MASTTQRLLSIQDACEQLGGIGKSMLYELIAKGDLTQCHIGRRAFVTGDSINQFVERLHATPRD